MALLRNPTPNRRISPGTHVYTAQDMASGGNVETHLVTKRGRDPDGHLTYEITSNMGAVMTVYPNVLFLHIDDVVDAQNRDTSSITRDIVDACVNVPSLIAWLEDRANLTDVEREALDQVHRNLGLD